MNGHPFNTEYQLCKSLFHNTFETEINLLDFNPRYPKEPKSLGEQIRKVRMDKGLMIKELASQLGVSEDTVINWEIRGRKPKGMNLERIKKFLMLKD